ncbi:MAG: hypothetical protein ABSA32_02300 [Candidatus Acidiferrales bacterium]|jgi:hypothetical protein
MQWYYIVAYFFGGAFFVNAIPHFVSGVMGRKFTSPFASPPGKGLSSAAVNVLWGAVNFVAAYVLILRVGAFNFHSNADVAIAGIGGLAMGINLARAFGKLA